MTLTLWRRPTLWIAAAIAVAAYWDPTALRGVFIYDDVASVINNDVVMVKVPWTEAFTRDFWGQLMIHPASHKSYRPITTLTLRWNMVLSLLSGTAGGADHTYYFHVVNVILHGINTGLIAETAGIVFGPESVGVPLVAGILFGIHPVHAEAVSNITSRGELLMTFFFLLSFLSYANHIPTPPIAVTTTSKGSHKKDGKKKVAIGKGGKKAKLTTTKQTKASTSASKEKPTPNLLDHFRTLKSIACLYILPYLFMALSLFSKEQGATTLCTLVAFDFIQNHTNLQFFVTNLTSGDAYAKQFLKRTGILALQTLSMVGLRFWLNGETSPDFVEEQNPAGFAQVRFTRVFSVNWTYCLYLRDMIFPAYLAPDWSGDGIPLIESLSDNRVRIVFLLWLFTLGCVYSLCVGGRSSSKQLQEARKVILVAFFAFLFLPFFLSSNILVTTGLAKADRVIYLPLFGYCLMQGLVYKMATDRCTGESIILIVLYAFLAIQFAFFGLKVQERNLAWASDYDLWTRAYQVNKLSKHTMSNAGRVLAKNKEYVEAEEALRPIGNVRTNGGNPNDTFLYTVCLSKLNRCEESFRLIDDAIEYIFEEREKGGIRYDAKMSFHAQSSLMISRAFCTDDIEEKGRIMQQAVTIDPNNDFAKTSYQSYLSTLFQMEQEMKRQQMGGNTGGGMPQFPQSQQEMMAMLQKMQQQGVPQEQLIELQQQWMLQAILTQEQLMITMQQLEKQGVPRDQLMNFQQRWMQQDQMRQQHGIQEPQAHGVSVPQAPSVPKSTPQNQDIPQNLGMSPQMQGIPPNMGMPPIEEFENGEFENVFFN